MEKKELIKAKEFLKSLIFVLGSVLLYSIKHSKTEEILFKPYDKLTDILRINNKFTVSVFEGEITAEQKSLGLAGAINAKLASLLKKLKIHDITFKEGITKEEWKKFIEAMVTRREKIDEAGGINNLFNTLGLNNISVNDTNFIKVPKDETPSLPKEEKEALVKEERKKEDTPAPVEKKKEETPPSKKILVVEDDEGERELFSDVIKKCNFVALEAADGLKALELIKDTKDIDLIILDIKLPKIHGLEILAHLKKMEKEIPVIICTAYSGLKDDTAVTFYPKIITMDKPVSLKELEENIKKIIS